MFTRNQSVISARAIAHPLKPREYITDYQPGTVSGFAYGGYKGADPGYGDVLVRFTDGRQEWCGRKGVTAS